MARAEKPDIRPDLSGAFLKAEVHQISRGGVARVLRTVECWEKAFEKVQRSERNGGGAVMADERGVRTNGSARTYDLRYFWNAYVGWSPEQRLSFPAHHSWGLVFAGQSVARSHQVFRKGTVDVIDEKVRPAAPQP